MVIRDDDPDTSYTPGKHIPHHVQDALPAYTGHGDRRQFRGGAELPAALLAGDARPPVTPAHLWRHRGHGGLLWLDAV